MVPDSDILERIDTCLVLAHVALERVSAKTKIDTLLAQRDVLTLKLALTKLKLALTLNGRRENIINNSVSHQSAKSIKQSVKTRTIKKGTNRRSKTNAKVIIEAVKNSGPITLDELAKIVPISRRTLYRHVKGLVSQGSIVRTEDDRIPLFAVSN